MIMNPFNFKNNKEKPFGLLLVIIGSQVIIAYIISITDVSDNLIVHIMYLPIVLAAFIFDYKIGILSAIIAELLIDVFMPAKVDLLQVGQLYKSLIRVFFFTLAGLIISFLKNHVEMLQTQSEKTASVFPETGLPTFENFVERTHARINNNRIVKFRFILIEINNQNELLASFGLDIICQLNQIIIAMVQNRFKNSELLQIRLNTFALVLYEIHQDIKPLISVFEEPIAINGIPIYCEITMGEASYPESGHSSEEILKNSFLALNEAKSRQKPYHQYTPQLFNPEIPILLGQFQAAIQNDEIEFHYQPITHTDGTVCALEALVRWNHPVKGMIPPDLFIPELEFTRITNFLTYYSLENNLDKMNRLFQEGFNLDISINISVTNLFQPDFSDKIMEIIHKHHFPPHHLSLEVTERGFLADDKQCQKNLDSLFHQGVMISIDDFGVGFTSISNFRNKGISSIKIDKSFVTDIHINEGNQAILEGIISIAKSSDILVVAEGIEKQMEKEKLLELGVDCLQGYLITKPLNFTNVKQWLKKNYQVKTHTKK